MLFACLTLVAALATSPLPAAEDVQPSKRQRGSLAIYVTAWSDRLATHFESLEKEHIERTLRKATYNQVSRQAELDFEKALVNLLMEDLGLKAPESRQLVEDDLAPALRKRAIEDSEQSLDRYGFRAHHLKVLRHDRTVLGECEELHDEYRLTKDQDKALRTLAELYANRMVELLGMPREKKRMVKLLTEGMVTLRYAHAETSARNKARGLLRSKFTARDKPKTDGARFALDEEIAEMLPKAFPETFWREMAFDHERCLRDPKAHRKVLKDVMRGKERPEGARPPQSKGEAAPDDE
ncbi:MAG: hypothetical protein AAF682_18075 [Planctomycetota bacterium]